VEIVTNFDEALEPFCFDLQQIKQALLNILVNALDATLPGDTIRIATGVRDGKVDVIIQDSGQGIDKEIIPEIFKPFYTTKNTWIGAGTPPVSSASSGTIRARSRSGAKLKKAQSS